MSEASLTLEGVPLSAVAEAAGTPSYVYSAARVREQYARLEHALRPMPHRIHYSAKANSSGAILRLLRTLGSGVDVVSGGELHRAREAGFGGEDIIFGGVGKTEAELRAALAAGVLLINVESEQELRRLDAIAGEMGRRAPVGLRVNPEVTVDAPHPYIRTGEKGNKFGIPVDEALDVARLALALPHTRLLGLDMHIGSQIAVVEPYRQGLERMLPLLAELRAAGAADLRFLDIGGGLAVTYDTEEPADLQVYASTLLPLLTSAGLTLIVEPGRFIVGNAGVLLTRVLYRKRSGGRDYVVTDAGMTELLRPSHYQAYHRIEPLQVRDGRGIFDVVGPVCESGDFLALGREMAAVEPGDLLAVHSAGAYGYAMASNYNSRPRPAEVLVDGSRYAVVTERETVEDLIRREVAAPSWRSI